MERRPLTQPSPSRGKRSGGGEHDRCGSVPSDRCYLDRTRCATWATRRSLVSCSAGANGFPASPEAKPHCGLTASTPSIVPCCPYSLADGETEPMGSTGLACQSCRVAGWALSARASNLAQTIYGWSSRPPSPQAVPAMTLSRPTRLAYLTRRSATSSGCSMKSVAWPTIPGMRTFPLGSLGFQEQLPDNLR